VLMAWLMGFDETLVVRAGRGKTRCTARVGLNFAKPAMRVQKTESFRQCGPPRIIVINHARS
jgi:hypothetical protein